MKADIKEKWVSALRSDEYVQGIGQLHACGNFCCLGVLCDLHAKETGGKWDTGLYLGEVCFLPIAVVDWAGLDLVCPAVTFEHNEGVTLATLNDNGKTFKEIADIIDSQL